jgi:hypothetical protein
MVEIIQLLLCLSFRRSERLSFFFHLVFYVHLETVKTLSHTNYEVVEVTVEFSAMKILGFEDLGHSR